MSATAITKAPCAKCPFRKDVPIYLRRGARLEIAENLRHDGTFYCHATVDYDTEDEDDQPNTSGSTPCHGAIKALAIDGGASQLTRVSGRLGMLDLDEVEAHPIQTWGLDEWTRLAEEATGDNPEWEIDADEVETCSVVGPDCEAPAGFLSDNGAVSHGTEEATERCKTCDEPVCSACISPGGYCDGCARWDDPDSEEYRERVES